MKLVKTALGAFIATSIMTGIAMAGGVGVVDMQEISQKYTKVQSLETQAKSKEEELQKLKTSLMEQLKAGEKLSPVEKKNLEDKLNTQYITKFKEYRDWRVSQEQTIKTDFDKAIQEVSTSQSLDLVLPKQTVLNGGKDITQDVINSLNK